MSDQASAMLHAGNPSTSAGAVLATLPLGSFMGFVFQDDATLSVINQLLVGNTYINIRSTAFPDGMTAP